MKKGITFGVFDIFHLGHLYMIKRAKNYCDYLIVAVHNDKLNTKNVEFLYTLTQRMEMVGAIKYVDEVISYERVDLTLADTDFDALIHGPDQNHKYFQKAFAICQNKNKELIEMSRTPGLSSTDFRNVLQNKQI